MFVMATACASAARNGDIEFLRGCWVAKDQPGGRVTGFLRLLPASPEGPAYEGDVQVLMGNLMRSTMRLSFARDGSAMTMARAGGGQVLPADPSATTATLTASPSASETAGLPGTTYLLTYATYPGQEGTPWIAAGGDADRLTIYSGVGPSRTADLFSGERDGCD
jgi:hypothetical protein